MLFSVASVPIDSWIGVGETRCRRQGIKLGSLLRTCLASIFYLAYLNVPITSATTSTSSKALLQFECSDTGYLIADSSGAAAIAGRSILSQSPAAIAILKSMLKEQKQAPSPSSSSSIFMKECGCQHDWMSAFCLRADKYRAMDAAQAPSVCICRRKDEEEKTCSQFLARCFPTVKRFKAPSSNSKPTEMSTGSCSCCFNQPDNYCTQLECHGMYPDFGVTNHTSCKCYNQTNYPHHICAFSPDQPSIELWNGGVTPIEAVIAFTSRPSVPASSNAKSKSVGESWLTQRVAYVGVAALFSFFLIICGGILFTKSSKERRNKNTIKEEGNLEESNELDHLNQDRCVEGNRFMQTPNIVNA